MLSIGIVGESTAGGQIVTGSPNVRVLGVPVAVLNSKVAPHGRNEHKSAVMVEGSLSVRANGIPVCRTGHHASCGHVLISNTSVRTI